jgi:hypothetical protein
LCDALSHLFDRRFSTYKEHISNPKIEDIFNGEASDVPDRVCIDNQSLPWLIYEPEIDLLSPCTAVPHLFHLKNTGLLPMYLFCISLVSSHIGAFYLILF